ncbi:hypothetical protein CDAR_207111 [Caerostris darwini]|uniref:Uncharacterized protein n=1 Tax=Caerostris darwini TaxID=1538125 RepID=A0AAV4SME8_9ARAC|nr:hypothetical protein CDAR_207111 [Caerostris darwini]
MVPPWVSMSEPCGEHMHYARPHCKLLLKWFGTLFCAWIQAVQGKLNLRSAAEKGTDYSSENSNFLVSVLNYISYFPHAFLTFRKCYNSKKVLRKNGSQKVKFDTS